MAKFTRLPSFKNVGTMWDLSRFPVDFQSFDNTLETNVGVFSGFGKTGRPEAIDNDSVGGDPTKVIVREGLDGDTDGVGLEDYGRGRMKRISSNDLEGVALDLPKGTTSAVIRILDAADIQGTKFLAKVGDETFELLEARQESGNVFVARFDFDGDDSRRIRFVTQRPYGDGKPGDGWAITCVSICK